MTDTQQKILESATSMLREHFDYSVVITATESDGGEVDDKDMQITGHGGYFPQLGLICEAKNSMLNSNQFEDEE